MGILDPGHQFFIHIWRIFVTFFGGKTLGVWTGMNLSGKKHIGSNIKVKKESDDNII